MPIAKEEPRGPCVAQKSAKVMPGWEASTWKFSASHILEVQCDSWLRSGSSLSPSEDILPSFCLGNTEDVQESRGHLEDSLSLSFPFAVLHMKS